MFIFYYYYTPKEREAYHKDYPHPGLVNALIDVSTQNLANEKKYSKLLNFDKNSTKMLNAVNI